MIKHKVAMIGAFAVGKTSLVQRYVTGIFSDRYLTTVGVRIDKREVEIGGQQVALMLWDLQGEDEIHSVPLHHLRGSSGFLVVADGTRAHTLDTALRLREQAIATLGDVPSMLLLNKYDLIDDWEIPAARLDALAASGLAIARTSAKTGTEVPVVFEHLTHSILGSR